MDRPMTDVRQYSSSAQTPAATRQRAPPTGLYMPLISPCAVGAEPWGGAYDIAWIPPFPAQWCPPPPPAILPPYILLQTRDLCPRHLLHSCSRRVNDGVPPLSSAVQCIATDAAKVHSTLQSNVPSAPEEAKPENPSHHRGDIIALRQKGPYPTVGGDVQKEQKEKPQSPVVPPPRPPEGQKSGPATGRMLPVKKLILHRIRMNHQIQDGRREEKGHRTRKTEKCDPTLDPKTISCPLKQHEKKAKRR
ncbi:uncharacterized protein LOC143784255 [Ranitomeya variabilis]|uniref:uncharacterized protein LOC143784255 n=1 Tax=Ranitomeya variabilis TaxID=490064 RepID=UPI004056958C